MATPEFILRKLYVPGSFQTDAEGFSFVLNNTFAPAALTGMALEVDGQPVPPDRLTLQTGEREARTAAEIAVDTPFPLPVGVFMTVRGAGVEVTEGRLTIHADTHEMGLLTFTIRPRAGTSQPKAQRSWPLPQPGLFRRPLAAEVEVDAGAVIGEIHPYIYGHFIEHLERCVYGGIWTEDGARLREDTLALVRNLKPPVIRYPGGNFASGYHWEDGIGPREARPRRHDEAWQSWESNQVGTDEFLTYCARVGADPFLVVNDGSGTAGEAARWVAYCNQAEGDQARSRAANGVVEPYGVRLWGVGNEVWGRWQIGHTDQDGYAARLVEFVDAMRAVDPTIQIVSVGDGILDDAPDNPARLWNEAVLRRAGDRIDYLSFHIYQPEKEGWQEMDDLETLHHAVCVAPLDVEAIIRRMASQIESLAPGRAIGIALDEWNLWLPPPPGAETMHRVVYTLRDALYVAGMFHVFHRQCESLTMANLAQLVNVLPLIVTDQQQAIATAIYFPFLMYRQMERLALQVSATALTFDSSPYGTIGGHNSVPYLDVTATCDQERQRLVLGLINRHPARKMRVRIALRGLGALNPVQTRLLTGPDPLAANTLDAPGRVRVQNGPLPMVQGEGLRYDLPASSVAVLLLQS
jgi:alpha-N-arabinofuranosidase